MVDEQPEAAHRTPLVNFAANSSKDQVLYVLFPRSIFGSAYSLGSAMSLCSGILVCTIVSMGASS
jgi:hypothetical protein